MLHSLRLTSKQARSGPSTAVGMIQQSFTRVSSSPTYMSRTWEGDVINKAVRMNQKKIGRRIFNTHLRWDMMPTTTDGGGEGARYIYMVRDGRDVAVSYYHHLSNMVSAVL